MKARIAQLVLTVISLAFFTACLNLGRSPATRFYLLESKSGPALSLAREVEMHHVSIGIGPVAVPPYLDRPQMMTRMDGNELRPNEFNQWAEPLMTNISRVMGANLSLLTEAGNIHSYPWKRSAVIDFQITLDVLQFEVDSGGRVTLKGVWRIFDPDNHQLLMERRSTITQTSAGVGVEPVVETMDMVLAELSIEMAEALIEVSRGVTGARP